MFTMDNMSALTKDYVLEEEVSLPRGRVMGRVRDRGRGCDNSVVGTPSTQGPAVHCGEATGDRNKSFFQVSSVSFFINYYNTNIEK